MELSKEEKSMLRGDAGPGVKRAMEILDTLGRIQRATRMVQVSSVQVSGVSYANIGEYGLSFLEEWADSGAKSVVPAYMNPGGADMTFWKELGFPADFVSKQERVIAALVKLGIVPALTCTPYHAGLVPGVEEHVAWAESSAVSYANSVLGARTEREGGPSAIAAALTGRTPFRGLHTDEGRHPTRLIKVECDANTISDAGALGTLVGNIVSGDRAGGIPYITGVTPPDGLARTAWFKALGAAMAAAGSVGLYYVEGYTPEAIAHGEKLKSRIPENHISIVESLSGAYQALISAHDRSSTVTSENKIDLVALGCPHAGMDDLKRIAGLIDGETVMIPLWIFVSRAVRSEAEHSGVKSSLEKAGIVLVADTCMVVAPLADLGIRTVAVDSAKAAHYLPSHQGVKVYFGDTEDCVIASVKGTWKWKV